MHVSTFRSRWLSNPAVIVWLPMQQLFGRAIFSFLIHAAHPLALARQLFPPVQSYERFLPPILRHQHIIAASVFADTRWSTIRFKRAIVRIRACTSLLPIPPWIFLYSQKGEGRIEFTTLPSRRVALQPTFRRHSKTSFHSFWAANLNVTVIQTEMLRPRCVEESRNDVASKQADHYSRHNSR